MQITGTTVYDSTNSLGDTAALKSKISALSKKHNVDLHMVVIDKFENPSTSSRLDESACYEEQLGFCRCGVGDCYRVSPGVFLGG